MTEHYPEQKECILPSYGVGIYVPVYNFVNSLFSLLTAMDLMQSKNLLFLDCQNPAYVVPRDGCSIFGDINTGNAYYEYYDRLSNKDYNVIIPLMLFADGMQIDKNGRICQEPWMYTLGIFNRKIRNQAHAWRNFGLIKLHAENLYTDDELVDARNAMLQGKPKPQPSDDNYVPPTLMNWHSQVTTIFEMLLDVQNFLSGMKWKFVIDGVEGKKTYGLKLPIMVVMGDMLFLNKLIGF